MPVLNKLSIRISNTKLYFYMKIHIGVEGMKRIIFMVFIFILIFYLCGCVIETKCDCNCNCEEKIETKVEEPIATM